MTVIDNGELPNRRGSLNIDDEGTIAREKVLIENGVLKGYMVDKLSGGIMGIESTGSGRRQSYKHAPMPRMTNTYMAAGPHTHEEIVQQCEKWTLLRILRRWPGGYLKRQLCFRGARGLPD